MSRCQEVLLHDGEMGSHIIYRRCSARASSRHPEYVQTSERTPDVDGTCLESVDMVSAVRVRLHSWELPPRTEIHEKGFLEELRGWTNQSLWWLLACNGDGE